MAKSKPPLATVATLPAPTGGWNARDAMPNMDVTDAVILDNWIPGTNGVSLRQGYIPWVTGFTAPVQSLMEYSAPSGGEKLFAASGSGIYDATSAGTVGSAVVSSLTSALWQSTMFATSGGNFLVCCNGEDPVQNYSGSAWSEPAITGVTPADLISVHPHMSRLWFVEKNSLRVWYLAPSSISGTASPLDLGPLCKLGGSLVAMASWTMDGGDGPNDLAVFITTKGETIIYQGTDPTSSTTWSLVGVFKLAEPIGPRPFVKAGADVGVLTSQGAMPLSLVLPLAAGQGARRAFTDKISGAFNTAYSSVGNLTGWQVMEYPKGGIIICNVPQVSNVSVQYVMSGLTGAWCSFSNLPANCWSLMGDLAYFGGTNAVYQFDIGNTDNGGPITGTMLPAFSSFGTAANKQFTQARPLYIASQGTVPPVIMKLDYDISPVSLSTTQIPSAGPPWDTVRWDTSIWGPATVTNSVWQSVQGIGQVGSVFLQVASETPITINKIDVMFKVGGPI